MDACAPKPGDRVIHIGAGSGYSTAILAELVRETGQVIAFEIDEPLASEEGAMLLVRHVGSSLIFAVEVICRTSLETDTSGEQP